jgi:DNA-binding NtrC family response regulator
MNKVTFPEFPVLIVDDEPQILDSYQLILRMGGIDNIVPCHDSRQVMPLLESRQVDLVVTDVNMPYVSGVELLEKIKLQYPQVPVIVVTVNTEVETAVDCMKMGALDYILKPVEDSRLVASVKKALEIRRLRRENALLKQKLMLKNLDHPEAFYHIITKNERMHSIFHYMEAIKNTGEPVLITGETGTGKGLVARAFHRLSRRSGDFVNVNVGGLDDQMFADTLFGHKKGAFTDAVKDRQGLIEKAAAGVLFLDEIGDLSMHSQVKLLHLVQEKEYYPLGADEPRYSDTALVVATNKDLRTLREDKFRKDLFYRLDVHHVHLPPLRQRPEDLPLLVDHFLEEAAQSLGKKKPTPPPELFSLLALYPFPGNIRELRSIIFKALSLHKSKMLSLEFFKEYVADKGGAQGNMPPDAYEEVIPTLKEIQDAHIRSVMAKAGNNQTIAAKILGISQQALSKRLKKKVMEYREKP